MAPPLFTISLDGTTYPIDTVKYRAQSQEALRGNVATSNEASDTLFNPEGAFSRYRYSWHHGAGQQMDDLREDADPYRFHDSHQVNVWTENEATLLLPMVNRRTVAGNNPQVLAVGAYLYLAEGVSLWRSTDGATWTLLTGFSATIRSLASDGLTLYVATDNETNRWPAGSSGVVPFTNAPGGAQKVAFVAGHLLIGAANVLKEVASTGTTTTIKTHFQASFQWTTIFSVGSKIYAGGYAGTQSELYTLTAGESSLALSQEATTLPAGELLYSALSHAGVVVFCTSKGVRLAQVGQDGTLTYGPLIELASCFHAVADGRFVWVTGTRLALGWGFTGTVRLALDTFTEPLKPAYAWDVGILGTAAPTSVARFQNVTYVGLSSLGLFGETSSTFLNTDHTSLAPYLISGRMYFGTVEPKHESSLVVKFDELVTGAGVTVSLVDEDNVVYTPPTPGSAVAGDTSLSMDASDFLATDPREWFKVAVRFIASSTLNVSPTLRQWRLRAYPVPPSSKQWILPIMLTPRFTVGAGAGQVRSQDVHSAFDEIVGLWVSKVPVTYSMGATDETVRVDAYDFEPSGWGDDGQWLQGVLTVRLVSVS